MILAMIPYCGRDEGTTPEPGRDFGHAINQAFTRLRDDDWGLVLDHDLCLTTSDWFRRLEASVEQYPDAGFFTLMRAPASKLTRYSEPEGVDRRSGDIYYHRAFGRQLAEREAGNIEDITDQQATAGIFLVRKQVWQEVGGFKTGWRESFIDYDFHERVKATGRRLYLIRDVYLYHANERKRPR